MKQSRRELTYDIETSYLLAYLFGLGKQVVRHGNLVAGASVAHIICITYCINDGPVECLTFDINTGSDKDLIERFDKIVKSCDVVIGKNSDSFDVRHINTQRLLAGLPAFPDWADVSEDLEKQLRKYFWFPSYSLDYVSELLGYGGKRKMESEDWKNILNLVLANKVKNFAGRLIGTAAANAVCHVFFNKSYRQVVKDGLRCFKKMCEYGKKDTKDTRKILVQIRPYVKPKHTANLDPRIPACIQCGSKDVVRNGTSVIGTVLKQRYKCKDCGGFAGYRAINTSGKEGKMTIN